MSKQTVENYLSEFSRRSVANMCHNMKVHEATLLRLHVNNAADIRDRADELDMGHRNAWLERGVRGGKSMTTMWDMDRRNAWLEQRRKALAILCRHFGTRATFCNGTDGHALQAIHCYAANGMPNAVINIPQREETA